MDKVKDCNMTTFKKYLILFALTPGYAASYMLPYIKYVFYDQLLLATGCNNEQAGLLLTIYTVVNLALYIPGGWVADKFNVKYVLFFSLLGTGLLNFYFAYDMTYSAAIYVWIGLSFTTNFAFWAGMIKAIRMLGTPAEQGKMYGFFSSGVGVFSAVLSSLGLFIYGALSADAVSGLKGVVVVQGAACVIAALCVLFLYAEAEDAASESEDDKFQTRDVLKVLKNPMTWVISILIFCGHGIYTSQSYFNPYMTNVIGVTLAFSGVLAIVRTHILRLVCGPLGGILADKVKSPGKVLIVCFAFMSLLLGVFIMLPVGTSAATVIGLQLLLAAITFTAYSIVFSCVEEVGIPRKLTGTTVAMASMLGYLPDMIYNPLFGMWIDKYNNDGYIYIFTFLALSGVVGMLTSFVIYRKGVAHKQTILAS